ncbi:MAG: 6-carboxytetrahydropterin synthase [Thermoanaerobaculia bacterium]|nr:6-carboxytetrahydropterin synthase [Thermoanaerobaculia bacterium]
MSVSGESYEMVLAKEDFKFSVAHFTVFSASEAEVLHGHNYRVRVRVAGDGTDELGLMLDLRELKTEIRRVCASLDAMTLVPTRCSLVAVDRADGRVRVRFGELDYDLPEACVVALDLLNTSIEELARYVWDELAPTLAGTRGVRLAVDVEETAGQSCTYAADLPAGPGDGA